MPAAAQLAPPAPVPVMTGARYPAPLGPAARGNRGRVRGVGQLHVSLTVPPACSISSPGGPAEIRIACSSTIPFRIATGPDAGARRFVVEY